MPTSKVNKNRGLGRGFDVLLPRDFDSTILMDPGDRVQKLSVELIQPNGDQPRRHFDEESLQQLADSIKQYGILQPLIVTPLTAGGYTIIAGERRWRASQKAGLKSVPAIIRSSKELEQLEIALVENVQRVDLSPLEQAASIERLNQQFNLTYEVIAKRLGKAVSTIHNIVRLLQLPEEARTALHEKAITEGRARAILSLKDFPDKEHELLKLIIDRGWSVRQAERFVTAFKAATPDIKTKAIHSKMRSETPQTKRLSTKLGSQVNIRRMAHGGKLEIGFTSDKDFERIISLLLQLKK